MVVTTQIHDLSTGPINLRAVLGAGVLVSVQNVSTTTVYFGELAAEPATTDDGMLLAPGAIFQVSIDVFVSLDPTQQRLGAWVWARSTGMIATTRAFAGLL